MRVIRIGLMTTALVFFIPTQLLAAITQVGTLNTIDDPGNLSDGLSFLDLSITDGLDTLAAAAAAALAHPGARLALPTELDDLYLAAGVVFAADRPSHAWAAGPNLSPMSGVSGYTTAVGVALGPTYFSGYAIWTDPDGSAAGSSTRDYFFDRFLADTSLNAHNIGLDPPDINFAFLYVLDATGASPVPAPGAAVLVAIGLAPLCGYYKRRRSYLGTCSVV